MLVGLVPKRSARQWLRASFTGVLVNAVGVGLMECRLCISELTASLQSHAT